MYLIRLCNIKLESFLVDSIVNMNVFNIFQGDSGGPVTRNGKLVGIMSFGMPCAEVPDIHTNVFTHLSFIKSVIDL
jgi:secreted trypsin-like serine protease